MTHKVAPARGRKVNMLDQLIESKSVADSNRKRGGLLLTTAVLTLSVFMGGLLWSLFAQNVGVGGEGLELSTLIAPVPLPEPEPKPEPEPEKKINKNPDVDIRKEIIRNLDESPVKPPKEVSIKKSDIPARRKDRPTMKGTANLNSASAATGTTRVIPGNAGSEIGSGPAVAKTPEPKKAAPPPPPPPPKKKIPKRISGGVVNGKAISLPKPPYPAAARAVRAKGRVSVSVLISKTGRVMSASAKGGHPLLRAAAVSAARRARFRPTKLSGVAVEVTGVIVYNFKP